MGLAYGFNRHLAGTQLRRANGSSPCPGGTSDNSPVPPSRDWVELCWRRVPKGRLKIMYSQLGDTTPARRYYALLFLIGLFVTATASGSITHDPLAKTVMIA